MSDGTVDLTFLWVRGISFTRRDCFAEYVVLAFLRGVPRRARGVVFWGGLVIRQPIIRMSALIMLRAKLVLAISTAPKESGLLSSLALLESPCLGRLPGSSENKISAS